MSIDDLPVHPGLQLAPAGCYLPASVPLPDAATLAATAAQLARRFPTPFPATAGEVEMVAAGLAIGCTSPRWRVAWFWREPVEYRAYDFRKMAEFMVAPDRFESARGRGWSPAWAREIHFQMPDPSTRRVRVAPPPITPPPIPYEPGESIPDWLQRVAEHRQAGRVTPEATRLLRNRKYDDAPHLDAEMFGGWYDGGDGEFSDNLDPREDW